MQDFHQESPEKSSCSLEYRATQLATTFCIHRYSTGYADPMYMYMYVVLVSITRFIFNLRAVE
jgi:hypothetical protein